MPIEGIRGCGWRTVGSMYLVGGGMTLPCDRLPMGLDECPVCGNIPHFIRSVQKIDPLALWGVHEKKICKCKPICPLCNPETKPRDISNYLQWVGNDYTPESFIKESDKMGVSKKINNLPKDLVVGKSWVYLARQDMIENKVTAYHPKKTKKKDAIFFAFIPQKVEYLMEKKKKEEYSKEEILENKEFKKRGITIVWVEKTPENDVHFAKRKGKRRVVPKSKKEKPKTMDLSSLLKKKD
jgi:hypothetical protein